MCAVLFGEPQERRVAEQVAGDSVVAPTLLSYEVANSLDMRLLRAASEA